MLKISALALSALLAGAGLASAQTVRTATIQPGKPARIAVITAFKADCSIGAVGSIRVITPPKSGSIVVRGGELTTPASFRCASKKTPVQALFYEPNRNFQGTDEISYETKSTEGVTETVTLKINVTTKPAAPKSGVVDL